jgi:thiol-disulfide isomerase/thioredoxin
MSDKSKENKLGIITNVSPNLPINISDYINNAINNINVFLFNNKYKMIIIYSDNCEYCQEYLDDIDKNKGGINIEIIKLNIDYPMDNKIWAKSHGVKVLPCTLFMDKENKIRGKVDGKIPMDRIKEDINKIFGEREDNKK